MDRQYVDTVRLLLEAASEVFRTNIFAMKGGTALNLFVQDMPRLSDDIDVVYVLHTKGRAEALAEITTELGAVQRRLEGLGIEAEIASSKNGDEMKILARRGREQVKIETNHVFRCTLPAPFHRRRSRRYRREGKADPFI